MIKNRNTVFFIVTMAAAVILNVFIGYTNLRQQNYISYGGTSISRSNLEYASGVLSSYDSGDYRQALRELEDEYTRLENYRCALAVVNSDRTSFRFNSGMKKDEAKKLTENSKMTDAEANERQIQITYCMYRLNYAVDYPRYLNDMKNNVSSMMDVSIFSNKVYKDVVRAENEFYGLEDIRISAESDVGIVFLLSDNITDIMGVASAVLCALFFTFRCRASSALNSAVKGRMPLFTLLFALGAAVLYISNIFVTDSFISLGDLDRSVQSVESFRSCPYIISVGTLAAIRIVFKSAACVIVYFLCTAIFSSKKIWHSAVIILTAGTVELLLYMNGSEIRFFTLLKPERAVGYYKSIFIFGEAVNSAMILSVFAVVIFAASGFLAVKMVSGRLLQSREESEKRYYNEVNDKYTETRIIRHDIKNHLTAVAMLMDEGRIAEARKYLDDISVEMDNARMPLQTGSAVLDALLFKKYEDMRKAGIAAETEFNVSFYDTGISEYDLCSIFGNILDNAIEAARELPPEDRKVKLSVRRQMDMICIFCENGYSKINKDLSTLKADKSIHGLGLNRVRRAAEKYSGTVDITAADGVFTLSIIIAPPVNSNA